MRAWAAGSLWWLGQGEDISAAIPALSRHLDDPDPSTRRQVASALGDAAKYGAIEEAHGALVTLLQDESAEVRKVAYRALSMSAEYGGADLAGAMPTLFEILLTDPDRENRGEAAYVISRTSKQSDLSAYVHFLTTALEDEFQRVRFYCARTLHYAARGGTDIRPAIPALVRALEDEESVAAWAVEALLVYAANAERAGEVLKTVATLNSRGEKVDKVVRICQERLAGP